MVRINKEELIDTILANKEGEIPVLRALDQKLSAVMVDIAELKKVITSPDSFVTKKFAELHDRIDM